MIIVRLSGGMGNQMFQYACGRALAIKHNVPLALDRTFLDHRISYPHFLRPHFTFRDYQLDIFSIDARIADPKDISWWNRPIFWGKLMIGIDAVLRKLAIFPGWERSFYFDEQILSLGPNAYLNGFWQSEKYFSNITETIRQDFTLKEPLARATQILREEIQKEDALCVHVRRSDLVKKAFHGACDLDYYMRGIAHIAERERVSKIYVFSDDIAWCKENVRFNYLTSYVGMEYSGTHDEGHLALMSACKHFIIPNSTFSWWAAWLGNHPGKIVIAPNQWFGNKTLSTKDLIPENWVRL